MTHKAIKLIAGVSLSAILSISASAEQEAGLFRFPDVSATDTVFMYASDLWVVPKEGGKATRLTSSDEEEIHPKFSPDGKHVAFSAPYGDGNQDIYILPVEGGVPVRVTYHPAYDRLLDWSPDGKSLLFASDRESYRDRFSQLYIVSVDGGMPQKLPVPYGEMATFSPDGKAIIYSYLKDFQNQPDVNRETWKGYRGGRAPDLWYYNLEDGSSRKLTTHEAPDSAAMWTTNGVYFLSERGDQVSNLWKFDESLANPSKVTSVTDYDVTRPSYGPEDIVFERNGLLYRLNLNTENISPVSVELVEDATSLQTVRRKVQDRLSNASLSDDAKSVLMQARGELFIANINTSIIKSHGLGSSSAERFPSLSPDGKQIAFMSDSTGEYQLHLRDVATGAVRTLTNFENGYRYSPHWSPDGNYIAFIDNSQRLYVIEVSSGDLKHIDTGLWRYNWDLEGFTPSWSSDSRWLAYDRGLENRNNVVFLYDLKEDERHQITSGMYSDRSPVFSADDKKLYLISARKFDPVFSDIDFTWAYANSTTLAEIPLSLDADGNLSQDNLEKDLTLLDVPAGNYRALRRDGGKLVYSRSARSGTGSRDTSVFFYDLDKKKENKVVSGVSAGFDVAGNKLLVRNRNDLHVVDLAPNQKLQKSLDLSTLAINYNRLVENTQVFNDAWRYERDYFYDPTLHGADWPAVKAKYQHLLPLVRTDDDMSFLLREMAGELSGGHVWAVAVPRRRYSYRGTGLLGANFSFDNGGYRIDQIIDAGAHRDDQRSPLSARDLNVSEGDYILAINGVELTEKVTPWAALQGHAGKKVELMVNSAPTMDGARAITVKTLASDRKLRELAWVEANRQRVERLSDGQLGYIYVPDTSLNGQNELMRQYRSQFTKKGIVVDERFNSGGALGDRLVELLNRPPLVYFSNRGGRDYPLPELSHYGPKAMLINGWSYSGGDGFPLLFKTAGVGPLIGMRTWGGLIGPAASMPFVSGGRIAAPPQRVYTTDGRWADPNGAVPDMLVENDPAAMMAGNDPQLEAAISYLMGELQKYPAHEKPDYKTDVTLN